MAAEKREVINLSAARAARREAKGERPEIEFEGMTFELPVEMPLALVDAIARLSSEDGAESSKAMIDIARALFGEKFQDFMNLGPSVDDGVELVKAVAPAYGLSVGESEASEN